MSLRTPLHPIGVAMLMHAVVCSLSYAQTTAPAEVAFESFRYSGVDPLAKEVGADEYLNPIVAGLYPDPSICRAGEDFYLVNSTFSYCPGIPIFHSRDLVHWEQVGNALLRPSQTEALGDTSTNGGVYAPTIRYHEGKFYVINTLIGPGGGNFVITADRPEGPWSDPIWFRNVPGIDPSLFFDSDGRTYLVHNGKPPDDKQLYDGHCAIWLWEIDLKAGRTVEGPRLLVNGGTDLTKKPVWIEGPHLFKKDDWYYLSAAEGGTGTAHSQVVFRSRSVGGPYDPFSGNPILTQRQLPKDRANPVTCTGHADLIELPNGDWWAVFLGCRPLDQQHTVLMGRETFLLPVTWKDGWPIILPPDSALPRVLKRPSLPPATQPSQQPMTGSFVVDDEFNSTTLDPGWLSFRRQPEQWWRIDDGALRLRPRPVRLTSTKENPTFLCRRQQHADYEAQTVVAIGAESGDCDAGIAVFQDERHHYFLGIRSKGGIAFEVFVERAFVPDRNSRDEARPEVLKSAPLQPGARRMELKVTAKGLRLDFAYRRPGDTKWSTVLEGADASILSERVAGGFTGVVIGVHARTNP